MSRLSEHWVETRLHDQPLNRRHFLQSLSAGGALVLGVGSVSIADADAGESSDQLSFNAFLKITPDNRVIVTIKHLDKGQGVTTGLATIVAEELDADWQQVEWAFAPADASRYNNLFWGPTQGTGGSTSIANSWGQLRTAGAAARSMFVSAAASHWKVSVASITVSRGVVSDGTHSASLGELAELAAKQPVPEKPALKSAAQFQLIGRKIPRKDSPEKTHGTAVYTQDIQLPGMLTALVLFPPKLGGKLLKYDGSAAKKVAGVKGVVTIPRGVAVVADSFWAAKKARDLLKAEWDLSACETRSSAQLFDEYAATAAGPGETVKSTGDVAAAIASAGKQVDAEYRLPYLAHATMEPMNCVVKVGKDSAELWYGCQMPTIDQMQVSQLLGMEAAAVTINTQFAGGSFGRRASPGDYVLDAVEIARQFPQVPVKMVWTREDDIGNARFRPMAVHRVSAKVSAGGELLAWQHHAVAQPILRGSPFEVMISGPVDPTVTEGIADMPYKIPNLAIAGSEAKSPVSTLWWRSVGHSGNAFVVETFIDQLARAAGQDPLAFRQKLLVGEDRWLGVLNLAADKARWGRKMPKGQAQGIAVHKAMGSWVAQVAEVELLATGELQVHKVVCAIDCGTAVNPDVVAAQMEGSIGFALGAVFGEQITLKDGAPEQTNFDNYQPLRISRMPDVEVHIVASAEPPSGVGEPGVPPTTPAVANAVFALTGKPVTALPINVQV